MTLARAVQLLRKEFGPNSSGSKKLLLFGGSSVRFAWFAGSFCHPYQGRLCKACQGCSQSWKVISKNGPKPLTLCLNSYEWGVVCWEKRCLVDRKHMWLCIKRMRPCVAARSRPLKQSFPRWRAVGERNAPASWWKSLVPCRKLQSYATFRCDRS